MRELTPSERQIMPLIAAGWTSAEIARAQYKSLSTIKTQIQSILQGLHARNRAHAVTIWLALGKRDRGESLGPPVSVRVLGITEGDTKLAGDYSHGVSLLDRGGRLIARCRQCSVTEWITDSAVLVAFNDEHAEHIGVKAWA